jgi:hypothetical protein
MDTIAVPVGRARIEERGSQLRIVIPSKMEVVATMFTSLWLVGWAFGLFAALGGLLHPTGRRGGGLFLAAWLGMWILGGGVALLSVLWAFFGRQVITTTDRTLVVRAEILGLGRDRAYELASVKDLRCAPVAPATGRWRVQRGQQGTIAFDYGARTIRLGEDVHEAEAKMLVARLQARNPWRRH